MAVAAPPRDRCATVGGVFLRPGVSRNSRLYTKPMIIAAVKVMQEEIAAGNDIDLVDERFDDVGMATHHGAEDDTLRIVGRVTAVTVNEDGVARFSADLADTTNGRDIAALVTPAKPYLKGVSFRGNWTGRERIERVGSQMVETADGIAIKRIDFTGRPGVIGAGIDTAELAESTDGAGISESIEEVFVVDETVPVTHTQTAPATAEVTESSAYADPGYHGTKALKIGTPGEIRESWAAIHLPGVTESYSPRQVQRMTGKVKSAAQKAGFDIVAETEMFGKEILEAYSSVCIDNGPADLRVSAYIDDPSKLQAVTQKLAVAALAALYSLDPDNDGDIDLPDGDAADADPVCPACAVVVLPGSSFCPSCGVPIPVAESTTNSKEATVAEATSTATAPVTEAATTKPIEEMSHEELLAHVKTLPAAVVPPAATTTTPETGAVTTESADAEGKVITEADITRVGEALLPAIGQMLDTKVAGLRDEVLVAFGAPKTRKGLVGESGDEVTDLSTLSREERDQRRAQMYLNKLADAPVVAATATA